jgi:hypothetical protein
MRSTNQRRFPAMLMRYSPYTSTMRCVSVSQDSDQRESNRSVLLLKLSRS